MLQQKCYLVNRYISEVDDGNNFSREDYTNELIKIKEEKLIKLKTIK